ncbi:MAG: T9SS type A sorting domain-containing protein [Marinilabiliaceae bacterium]|nr:T9SS type A sorting domain-containing protein [Marinilabiliaceae bacterium]
MKTISTLILLMCTLTLGAQNFTFDQITNFISSGDDKTEFSDPENLFGFKGELYFTVSKKVGFDSHIYLAKLTADNNIETLHLLNNGQRDYAFYQASVGNRLFVTKQNNTVTELWWTEDLNTFSKIESPFVGKAVTTPANFQTLDGNLYYTATYSDYSTGLFSCNASNLSIKFISKHTAVTNIESLNNNIYYGYTDYFDDDGDGYADRVDFAIVYYNLTDGETKLNDDNYAAGTIASANFIKYNKALYFSGYTADTGYELFSYDGNNIKLIKDIVAGSGNSLPQNMVIVDNMLYFYTVDNRNMQLHKYNASNEDFTTCTFNAPKESYDKYVCAFKNHFFSNGYGSDYGHELFAYKDKSTKAFDINPKASSWSKSSSNPHSLKTIGDNLWFVAKIGSNSNIYKLYEDNSTSIDNSFNDSKVDFSIAPNPATTYFNVVLEKSDVNGIVNVFDLSGNIVLSQKISTQNTKVDTQILRSGLYVVQLYTDSGSYTQKLKIK